MILIVTIIGIMCFMVPCLPFKYTRVEGIVVTTMLGIILSFVITVLSHPEKAQDIWSSWRRKK